MERKRVREIIEDPNTDINTKIDAIQSLHHDELNAAFADRDNDLAARDESINNYKQQLAETKKTLRALQAQHQDDANLQETIQSNNQRIEELEKELKDSKIDSAIELELIKAGARNVKVATKVIDRDLINFDKKGNMIGLTDQINSLKSDEETSFLFTDKESSSDQSTVTQSAAAQEQQKPSRAAYNPDTGSAPKKATIGAQLADEILGERNRFKSLRENSAKDTGDKQ